MRRVPAAGTRIRHARKSFRSFVAVQTDPCADAEPSIDLQGHRAVNEEQFREAAQARGYGDFQAKDYAPHRDGPFHAHDFSVLLLVLDGRFSLAFEDRTANYRPGEVCELRANVLHTERAGPEGARVLLSKCRHGSAATPVA